MGAEESEHAFHTRPVRVDIVYFPAEGYARVHYLCLCWLSYAQRSKLLGYENSSELVLYLAFVLSASITVCLYLPS